MHNSHGAIIITLIVATAISCGKADKSCESADKTAASDCVADTSIGMASNSPTSQDLPPIPASSDLVITSVAWNGFTISWEPATDDRTSASKLEYQVVSAADSSKLGTVRQAASSGGVALSWTANIKSATVSGRPQNETRSYTVLVRDEVGNIAMYGAKMVTTSAEPSPVPGSGIVVTDLTGGVVKISWKAATSGGDSALTYLAAFASTAAEIDTVAKAEAVAASTGRSWLPTGVTAISVSGAGFGTLSYVAIVVKNSSGAKALYAPVAALP